jgi:hypothetical protein
MFSMAGALLVVDPLVYSPHPLPISGFALFPHLLPIHETRELRKRSYPHAPGRFGLVDISNTRVDDVLEPNPPFSTVLCYSGLLL